MQLKPATALILATGLTLATAAAGFSSAATTSKTSSTTSTNAATNTQDVNLNPISLVANELNEVLTIGGAVLNEVQKDLNKIADAG